MNALSMRDYVSDRVFEGKRTLSPETAAHVVRLAKKAHPTGFLATLSDEQKMAARDYRGEETHGEGYLSIHSPS